MRRKLEKVALPEALRSLRKVLRSEIRDDKARAILDQFLIIISEAENPEEAKRRIVAWIRERVDTLRAHEESL